MNHIMEFMEKTAASFPQKKAVGFREQSYTFAQMKECAGKIAAQILIHMISDTAREETAPQGDTAGADPVPHNQPVAVVVKRDADTAVFFLAVLISGNYYVPIDPEMPLAKKQSVLSDCRPKVLLCAADQMSLVEEMGFEGTVLTMDGMDGGISGEDLLEQAKELYSSDDPAYMVYTSGSTGKPKGVLKSHGAVCSFIRAFTEEFSLDGDTLIGNQTPFFFDASAKDYYLMLYTGATMEIIPSELFMYPPNLIDFLNERKVNYVCWVPTALAMVTQINTFKQVKPLYLKKVFFVGEVFPLKQLRRWMEALPEIEYANLYGSTELAGISCYCRLDTAGVPEYIPVGKPLSNCRAFLYDNEVKRVVTEQEKIGELCIISDAMAMEYYHDPQKTAQVFVTMNGDELGLDGVSGPVRVLKTGDLARYDANEDLVFSSRKDFQIKLMGRRIELGEIEASADKIPEIQRNCCIFDAEKRKIRMYCELVDGCTWSGREVRAVLKDRLSDYMVPSSVTVMEKLPLNANGKIDRNRLKSL